MRNKELQTETMEVTLDDYRYALTTLYKHYTEELRHHENKYKDWNQTAQVYALSKADGTGRPVPANIEAYNNTVVERRRLSIMIKFLRNEIDFIEKFWINKGFNLEELTASIKSKELQKFNPIIKSKEQVAGANANTKKQSESKKEETNPHKTLIVLKSEPPVQKNYQEENPKEMEAEKVEEKKVEVEESQEMVYETENEAEDIEGNLILSQIEGDDSEDINEEDS